MRTSRRPRWSVPDGVPYAEKSLWNQVTVQLVHLLQDIYPLVSSHQEAASPDPQARFDRAYTFPYRCVRDAPRWHPDLVAASASKNLLGALASGGPFAKLLERVDPPRLRIRHRPRPLRELRRARGTLPAGEPDSVRGARRSAGGHQHRVRTGEHHARQPAGGTWPSASRWPD